ncbi:MAG: histidine phosphatase family protein [Alphaproteobacteria bacterium]
MVCFLRRVFLFAMLVPVAAVAGCAGAVYSPPGTTTTVILLRHAERTPLTAELTERGRARAAALPAAVANLRIDAIYSPNLKRNLDTAAPLARARNLRVRIIEENAIAARLVGDNPGGTVVWVGNSDNLDKVYEDLRGDGVPPVGYGDLFILKVPDKGLTTVTRTRYGD